MHINLILGAVFLLALWWLLREARARKKEQKADPAAMLKDELEKRRAAQEHGRRAGERLAALKKERMSPVLDGLRGMIAALPAKDRERGGITAAGNGSSVVLSLKYADKEEAFILEWDVRHFDLELFAGEASLSGTPGSYTARLPDGSIVREVELPAFMRALSGLIADRLA